MSNGKYGIISPAYLDLNEVEVLYTYQENRYTEPSSFSSLLPESVITNYFENGSSTEEMGGFYKLKLPATVFNKVGIYNIVIRPKRIKTQIADCGSIATLPDVKGIVLDGTRTEVNSLSNASINGGLTGYRVEYINDDGSIQKNTFTVVTWNNKCEAITQNVGNSTQKSTYYRFNDSGSFIFLTLTPSTTTSTLPNVKPFIGKPNQNIYITNTNFDPLFFEVNLTKHDLDTLSYGLYGTVLENTTNGKLTVFDDEGNIYNQSTMSEIKDGTGKTTLYRIREKNTVIDTDETLENAKNGAEIV